LNSVRRCIRRRRRDVAFVAPVVEDGVVAVLYLRPTRTLLATALSFDGGALVPHVGLSVFCGLRPAEVARISWSDVYLAPGTIGISDHATKTHARESSCLRATLPARGAFCQDADSAKPARSG